MTSRKSDPLLKAGDIRVATESLYAGTAPAGDYASLQDDSLLAMPIASAEDEARRKALAARHVARRTMLTAHNCTGTRCGSAAHAAGRDVMHLVLVALGLREDPLSASHTDPWGRRVRPKDGAA